MSGRPIAIDARMWSHPGIGRYLRELVGALIAGDASQKIHLLGYEKDGIANTKVSSKIYSIAEQWEMARAAKGFSVFHVPHFNIPVLYRGRLVVTVHDLTYLHDAKASKSRLGAPYARFLFGQIQKKADAILTVSEYTKNDLLNVFPGIHPDRVVVTPEAASPLFHPKDTLMDSQNTLSRHSLAKPFVLYVGSLKEHKNIPVLIRAAHILRQRKKDVDLVLVGRRDLKNAELWNQIVENGSFVKYLGELPDEELVHLYRRAGVFVLPSFREGFGLPALEAMACGAPVIVSDRTSLPEIVGNAGIIFNPDSAEELSVHLEKVLGDESLRKDLSSRGIARAAQFSWASTARKTQEAYDRVSR